LELKNLFTEGKIGNVYIKNRIVRSATYERKATKYGFVNEKLIKLYTDLAQGGTGLLITGAIAVDKTGSGSQNQAYLFDDSYISGQKQLVNAVHDYSDVKIAAQLIHTGRQGSHPKYPPIAPSPIPNKVTKRIPHELTTEEIREVIKWFVDTSHRAYECGYDMVQMHAAHGYLLSNFISPYTNKRMDEFGGDTQKRTKILIDIYNQLRDEVGKNFPITIKLQTQDLIPGGLTLEEAKKITHYLVDVGYDAIEPSASEIETMIGTKNTYPSKIIKSPNDENYFLPTAKELKPIMKKCQMILMGGIRNPLSAEKILQENFADFISMSRPLIHEPDLPNRWKSGDLSPARCISCNSCYTTMYAGEVYCVVKKKLEEKKVRDKEKVL
jgi:2,4-dienoyl-CoA reductase-like NADH-dependent reductase (Old Yellow Enzyme family)